MFKVTIKKQNQITNQAQFTSQEEAQSWLDQESRNLSFGKIQREAKEMESVDEDGVITTYLDNSEDITKSISVRTELVIGLEGVEQEVRIHTLPADFTVVITDITAELLAQKESDEALDYLKKSDWMLLRELDGGTAMSPEVKALRAAARLKVI